MDEEQIRSYNVSGDMYKRRSRDMAMVATQQALKAGQSSAHVQYNAVGSTVQLESSR